MIQEKFKEYYSRRQPPAPPRCGEREFGVGYEKKIDLRHLHFRDEAALKDYFREEAPLYASYSIAYYDLPAARPMKNKGFTGADLAFDFDVARIGEHAHNPLICRPCLEAILRDALLLKEEFLEADFGFSSKEIALNYSGNKGYHVHVRGDEVRELDGNARRQLLQYVRGPEVAPLTEARHGTRKLLHGPGRGQTGWNAKFLHAAQEAVRNASEESLKGLLPKKVREQLLADKEGMVNALEEGRWELRLRPLWEQAFQDLKREKGLEPDAQVSLDLARLIRLPDSLHGSTGLLAKTIDRPDFDPFKHALAFSTGKRESAELLRRVEFEFAGQEWALEGRVLVPEAIAVFLDGQGLLVGK
ncbi:hypothetical protein AUJ15_01240 [Candidatus Micrarchaeota archaeon CG1_02_55_41]|nr:MAG: hypothetical protein AUJ15_01240 [Candidatus Micrarchaeota archaeon CG1_02_55_41]